MCRSGFEVTESTDGELDGSEENVHQSLSSHNVSTDTENVHNEVNNSSSENDSDTESVNNEVNNSSSENDSDSDSSSEDDDDEETEVLQEIKEEWRSNRVVYPSEDESVVVARTGEGFAEFLYGAVDDDGRAHQHDQSPLLQLNIDLVKCFVIDYMHLVCLGVVRRILRYLKGNAAGTNFGRLSRVQLDQISERLSQFQGKLPSEFARQPRSLSELDRWKATECRTFLLYTGIIALKGIVDAEVYKHFLSFTIAFRILCETNDFVRMQNLPSAQKLIEYFVQKTSSYYGAIFNVYNEHTLLHISEDVKKFNCSLDAISAFPFENFLGRLKRMIRGTHNPLVELAKRYDEFEGLVTQKAAPKSFMSLKWKDSCFTTEDGVVILKRKTNIPNTYMADLSNGLFYGTH